MAGTKAGGIAAVKTNKAKYGNDFYKKIGTMGGSVKNPNKGFGRLTREEVSRLGSIGGTISRKGKRTKQ